MTKTFITSLLLTGAAAGLQAQGNTAVASGSIGKCAVWDYPYTLYNTVAATQNIGTGITVTVDQNRNIGAVNLTGNGAMDMSGGNGITMSGAGAETICRWDINRSDSHSITNNDGHSDVATYFQNWGTFFTAPYSGTYLWFRKTGWSASLSGSTYNGGAALIKNNTKATSSHIFYQNESGSCPTAGTIKPATWNDSFALSGTVAGDTFQYGGGTQYATSTGGGACPYTTLNATVGNALVLFDN